MPNDKAIKEKWVYDLVSSLEPVLAALGFKKSGKTKYVKIKDGVEFRYLISIRHPRYTDDSHELYINPCIHVYFPNLERIQSKISGKPINQDFPTYKHKVA